MIPGSIHAWIYQLQSISLNRMSTKLEAGDASEMAPRPRTSEGMLSAHTIEFTQKMHVSSGIRLQY